MKKAKIGSRIINIPILFFLTITASVVITGGLDYCEMPWSKVLQLGLTSLFTIGALVLTFIKGKSITSLVCVLLGVTIIYTMLSTTSQVCVMNLL